MIEPRVNQNPEKMRALEGNEYAVMSISQRMGN
jgi:hypothetical protein